ncbi:MAG TPA: hypothetical protein VEU07_13900, partial [Candidatus Acidoferrum sp.]|nr:hypothetical protein [Candidatus Acidoferrum sp.]
PTSFLGGSSGFDPFGVLRWQGLAGNLEIVVGLEVHPELRAIPEIEAEAEGRVRRNAASFVHDLGDSVRGNSDSFGELLRHSGESRNPVKQFPDTDLANPD